MFYKDLREMEEENPVFHYYFVTKNDQDRNILFQKFKFLKKYIKIYQQIKWKLPKSFINLVQNSELSLQEISQWIYVQKRAKQLKSKSLILELKIFGSENYKNELTGFLEAVKVFETI